MAPAAREPPWATLVSANAAPAPAEWESDPSAGRGHAGGYIRDLGMDERGWKPAVPLHRLGERLRPDCFSNGGRKVRCCRNMRCRNRQGLKGVSRAQTTRNLTHDQYGARTKPPAIPASTGQLYGLGHRRDCHSRRCCGDCVWHERSQPDRKYRRPQSHDGAEQSGARRPATGAARDQPLRRRPQIAPSRATVCPRRDCGPMGEIIVVGGARAGFSAWLAPAGAFGCSRHDLVSGDAPLP
jgi:hypothetical protein